MIIYFFNTRGFYIGFIENNILFSRDGEYLGWLEGNIVWNSNGQYIGQLVDIGGNKYVLRNMFIISPLPRVPRVMPSPPAPPSPVSNIAPISSPIGWEDVFNVTS